MLHITVPETEFFDSKTNRFTTIKSQTIAMEHSLLSVSKWEAKWKKSYFTPEPKPTGELLDYFRCMTVTPNVNPLIYGVLTQENIQTIVNYISDPMTATTFSGKDPSARGKRHTLTSEEIYYQMTALNIPFECEKWHLNRLMTLIRICAIKNAPPKKRSKKDTAKRYSELNKQRTGY